MKLKVMLDEGAIMPTRAHESDAGLDLYTPKEIAVTRSWCDAFTGISGAGYAVIDTGVHVEIPCGYVGFLKSKSGLNVKSGLTGEGVIDAGYTGSIVVKLYNHTANPIKFEKGDKIIQLVILPCALPELELTDRFEETERGMNGFGSTGK